MARRPSQAASATIALQAAAAEQLEQAKAELERRRSSLAVTSKLAEEISVANLHSQASPSEASTSAATARRSLVLARQPSSQLAATLSELAATKSDRSEAEISL